MVNLYFAILEEPAFPMQDSYAGCLGSAGDAVVAGIGQCSRYSGYFSSMLFVTVCRHQRAHLRWNP